MIRTQSLLHCCLQALLKGPNISELTFQIAPRQHKLDNNLDSLYNSASGITCGTKIHLPWQAPFPERTPSAYGVNFWVSVLAVAFA